MANIGLYYPFIHFKDDNWLKLAALYWHKMARIVPPTYAPAGGGVVLEGDSDVTRSLADELGFVLNVEPTEATYPVSEKVGYLLINYSGELRERYGVAHRDDWDLDDVTGRYAQQRDARLAYVNSTKLSPYLIDRLAAEGLAESHIDEDTEEHWAGMHPRLAAVYMAALAEEAARVNVLHPVSDETVDHVAAAGWSIPRLAAALLDQPALVQEAQLGDDDGFDEAHEELPSTLALMAIKGVIPSNPEEVTVDQIVAIRNEFGEELFRFQALVDRVAMELPDLPGNADPAVVLAHVEAAYQGRIEPLLPELEAAMKGYGIDTVEAAMGTTLAMPEALPALPVADPFALGPTGVLSFIQVLRAKRRQAQQAYRDSPAAYLYRLNSTSNPRPSSNESGNAPSTSSLASRWRYPHIGKQRRHGGDGRILLGMLGRNSPRQAMSAVCGFVDTDRWVVRGGRDGGGGPNRPDASRSRR